MRSLCPSLASALLWAFLPTLLPALLCGGCLLSPGSNGSGDLDIEELIVNFETEKQLQSFVLCECFVEFGFESREECESIVFMPLSAQERACWASAFGRDTTGSSEYLTCIVVAQEQHTSCLNATLMCPNLDTLEICNGQLEDKVVRCGSIPADVAPVLNEC